MEDTNGKSSHERVDQAAQAIRDLAKPLGGFVMVLDFCGKKVHFSSGGASGGKGEEEIHFHVYDKSSTVARRIASLHFERKQWEGLVAYGNKLLEHQIAANDPP